MMQLIAQKSGAVVPQIVPQPASHSWVAVRWQRRTGPVRRLRCAMTAREVPVDRSVVSVELEWHLALTTEIVLRSGGRRIPIQVWPWARHTAQIGLLKNSVLAERPRPGTPFGRVYRDRTGDPTVPYPQFSSEFALRNRPEAADERTAGRPHSWGPSPLRAKRSRLRYPNRLAERLRVGNLPSG